MKLFFNNCKFRFNLVILDKQLYILSIIFYLARVYSYTLVFLYFFDWMRGGNRDKMFAFRLVQYQFVLYLLNYIDVDVNFA